MMRGQNSLKCLLTSDLGKKKPSKAVPLASEDSFLFLLPNGDGIFSLTVVLITFGCKINRYFANGRKISLKKPLIFARKL